MLEISPQIAFLLVSFCLGELGDGLSIFQGIYLVGIGWNEGSVGIALSLIGFTALLVQPWAGDYVDKTTMDRRYFLGIASLFTALSASTILLVHDGNTDHTLIFISKIIEGISASFIGPSLGALTLANFGPNRFDTIMANNIMWGHIGSVMSAILAGIVAYTMYPHIKYCFFVIALSAISALFWTQFLPHGDQLMGRGFATGKAPLDENDGLFHKYEQNDDTNNEPIDGSTPMDREQDASTTTPEAASYWVVFSDRKSVILCFTGFFFHFANANVLLVLGELMGGGNNNNNDNGPSRSAIPLIAGAIVTAQVIMTFATYFGGSLTRMGVGRKPLFMAGLVSLPIRCALIIWWRNAGDTYLLSTQLLDGVAAGLCGLIHPYLVADITFGTGRFNVLMGLTASFFGLGATLSNFVGQLVVERFGHVTSLTGSLVLSFIPLVLFVHMPETLGQRTQTKERLNNHVDVYRQID